jgi:phage baseplate assembly protein gpV
MSDMVDLIYRCIEDWSAGRKSERYGLVTSYDPQNHRAKVAFQPEGNESGWMPIHAQHMGNGWGIVGGLTPGDGKATGDLVKISYQEGDYENGSITSRMHSDVDKPPVVESGELKLQHASGATITFDKTGNLTLTGAGGATSELDASGDITHTDSGGGVIYQSGGKIYLGSKTATHHVMLDNGPATKVYGI